MPANSKPHHDQFRAGAHLTGGTDVVPYNGPTPPVGTHRYFVALFQQAGPGLAVEAPKSRCRFDVDSFAAQNALTRKADIVFKVPVRWPPYTRRAQHLPRCLPSGIGFALSTPDLPLPLLAAHGYNCL